MLVLVSATTMPCLPAAPFKATVPVVPLPPCKEDAAKESLEIVAGSTVTDVVRVLVPKIAVTVAMVGALTGLLQIEKFEVVFPLNSGTEFSTVTAGLLLDR